MKSKTQTHSKKSSISINDMATGHGVYEGDLRYGRCNGTTPNRKGDYSANRQDGVATNKPVVPLILAHKRDPQVWKRDPKLDIAKRSVSNSQHMINHMLHMFNEHMDKMNANIHLRVGRQLL
jgi:hypothetical protein